MQAVAININYYRGHGYVAGIEQEMRGIGGDDRPGAILPAERDFLVRKEALFLRRLACE